MINETVAGKQALFRGLRSRAEPTQNPIAPHGLRGSDLSFQCCINLGSISARMSLAGVFDRPHGGDNQVQVAVTKIIFWRHHDLDNISVF
jgi:hypothetical protein